MKYPLTTLFLFAAILLLQSCSKKSLRKEGDTLIGTWELRHIQGGMMPGRDLGPGNGNRLFFSDSTYERYENGTLVARGRYSIVEDKDAEKEVGLVIADGTFTTRIIFHNDPDARKTYLDVTGGSLVLLSGYFPLDSGVRATYRKTAKGD